VGERGRKNWRLKNEKKSLSDKIINVGVVGAEGGEKLRREKREEDIGARRVGERVLMNNEREDGIMDGGVGKGRGGEEGWGGVVLWE